MRGWYLLLTLILITINNKHRADINELHTELSRLSTAQLQNQSSEDRWGLNGSWEVSWLVGSSRMELTCWSWNSQSQTDPWMYEWETDEKQKGGPFYGRRQKYINVAVTLNKGYFNRFLFHLDPGLWPLVGASSAVIIDFSTGVTLGAAWKVIRSILCLLPFLNFTGEFRKSRHLQCCRGKC